MKGFFCLWAVLCLQVAHAQTGIKPLTIGDTLPPDLVLTNVLNHPVSEIRLSDLKGKLVILDFWGRYCAPCIKALPKLDSLQQLFKDSIQVIAVSDFTAREDLEGAMGKYKYLKNISIPMALADEDLLRMFPHKLVSHVVWIAPSGEIKAFTGTDYMLESNIRSVFRGEVLHWKMKKDLVDFDFRQPLLGVSNPEIALPKQLYYSAFTSHLDGVSPPNGIYADSSRESVTVGFYNLDLLSFCQAAIDMTFSPRIENFLLQVKDSLRFIKPAEMPKSLWRSQNTFCYNLHMPIGMSREEVLQIAQEEIRRWLQRTGINIRDTLFVENGLKQVKYIISDSGV